MSKQVSVILTDEMYKALEKEAHRSGVGSVAPYIRMVLVEKLEQLAQPTTFKYANWPNT
jgi:hypothetical protein